MKTEPDLHLEKPGPPDLPRPIALLALAAVSGFLVWSFHHDEWAGFGACLVVGGTSGCLAGGLVGVRLLPSLLTLAAWCGLIEGASRGWQRHGLLGAATGGLIGVVVAVVIGTLPVTVTHLVLVLRGIDPLGDAGGKEA